jgi:gamma-glutamylcyclotransferase (GGCT)/AIG2-like uncharacterized protein YtfP
MKNLFVYGSLMFDEVWLQLLGRKHQTLNANLTGYRRVQIHGQVYPGLKNDMQCIVDGVLVFNLSPNEIEKLDRFEGCDYQRESVNVSGDDGCSYPGDVYLIRPRYQHILSNSDWDPQQFKDQYLKYFLNNYMNW